MEKRAGIGNWPLKMTIFINFKGKTDYFGGFCSFRPECLSFSAIFEEKAVIWKDSIISFKTLDFSSLLKDLELKGFETRTNDGQIYTMGDRKKCF